MTQIGFLSKAEVVKVLREAFVSVSEGDMRNCVILNDFGFLRIVRKEWNPIRWVHIWDEEINGVSNNHLPHTHSRFSVRRSR